MKTIGRAGETALALLPYVGTPRLSVVIPVYNEIGTIAEVLRRVQAVAIHKEIIIANELISS